MIRYYDVGPFCLVAMPGGGGECITCRPRHVLCKYNPEINHSCISPWMDCLEKNIYDTSFDNNNACLTAIINLFFNIYINVLYCAYLLWWKVVAILAWSLRVLNSFSGYIQSIMCFSLSLYFQSFARNKEYIDYAKTSPNLTILAGGKCDDRCVHKKIMMCATEFLFLRILAQ